MEKNVTVFCRLRNVTLTYRTEVFKHPLIFRYSVTENHLVFPSTHKPKNFWIEHKRNCKTSEEKEMREIYRDMSSNNTTRKNVYFFIVVRDYVRVGKMGYIRCSYDVRYGFLMAIQLSHCCDESSCGTRMLHSYVRIAWKWNIKG